MAINVKITTKIHPVEWLCPQSCRGCGQLGSVFCECCKNDILANWQNYCPICGVANLNGVCKKCNLPFDAFYMVGWRDAIIGGLVADHKFDSIRTLGRELGDIMAGVLPDFINSDVAVVPLPTIQKHIRERGIDHTKRVAKRLAHVRGWDILSVLERKANTVQVGADAKTRKTQAKKAYEIVDKYRGELDCNKVYLLVDDVWTTGSSMRAAEKILRDNGASVVIACVFAVSR